MQEYIKALLISEIHCLGITFWNEIDGAAVTKHKKFENLYLASLYLQHFLLVHNFYQHFLHIPSTDYNSINKNISLMKDEMRFFNFIIY